MDPIEKDFLSRFPVVVDLPVQWGEMDAFGHVNNVVYFRYFESVRITAMRRTSIQQRLVAGKLGLVLAAAECQYKRPVTYPDQLRIGAAVSDIQAFGFVQSYAIYSTEQRAITTIGSGRIVLLNPASGEKIPIDDVLRRELETQQAAGE